jgi:hypothetical protein
MTFVQFVSSFHSSDYLSFQRREVASEKLVAAEPGGVNFVSASRPRWPINITLLTLLEAIVYLSFSSFIISKLACSAGQTSLISRWHHGHSVWVVSVLISRPQRQSNTYIDRGLVVGGMQFPNVVVEHSALDLIANDRPRGCDPAPE